MLSYLIRSSVPSGAVCSIISITLPRGKNAQEDESLKRWLSTDPKNRAENLMIVDLLRNDISRISKVGSVHVPELFTVETYETVLRRLSKSNRKAILKCYYS